MSEFRNYVAIIEQNDQLKYFAHIPDLPGVTVGAHTVGEVLKLVAEFADDYVRDLVEDGHEIPDNTAWEDVKSDPDVKEFMRAMVPVRIPPKVPRTVKISLSIDEEVLERIDRAVKRGGETRSGFFARAAGERADQILTPREMTQDEMLRAIERAGGLRAVLQEVERRTRSL